MTDDDWYAAESRRHNRDTYRHQPPDTRKQKIPTKFPDWMMQAQFRAMDKQQMERANGKDRD